MQSGVRVQPNVTEIIIQDDDGKLTNVGSHSTNSRTHPLWPLLGNGVKALCDMDLH